MSDTSSTTSRVSRRDRLRSLAKSTTGVIKQEINKYYEQRSSPSSTPTKARSIMSNYDEPNDLKRTDTQEIDEILKESAPEIVQPQCMLFPTYACQVQHDNDEQVQWKVVLAGWAFARPGSSRLDRWLLAAGRTYGGLSRDSVEDNHFINLLNQFRCNTMKMTDVRLKLPGIIAKALIHNADYLNSDQEEKIRDYAALVNTGPSGRFEHEILLDSGSVKELKENAKHLTVEASFEDNETPFSGYIDVIEPYGISIISDIDDTIKFTDVLDGKDAILQNTFFRKAVEVPHMSEVYKNWVSEGAHIHYVSNSPWQVYPALAEFLTNKGFPEGSTHLRAVSTQDLIIGKPGKHKLDIIPKIIKDFPHRKFILVGDSGEIDAEIYQQIYKDFPDQIIKIFIHDVTSQRAMDADRLAKDKPDSYYSSLRKFISKESTLLRKGSSSTLAMEAMAQTEIPEEQEEISNPEVPLLTKLEQFEKRMKRVSGDMREGVFTVFTLASQLMLDPVVAEEFLMQKTDLITL